MGFGRKGKAQIEIGGETVDRLETKEKPATAGQGQETVELEWW